MLKRIQISWDDDEKTILRRDAYYGWSWEEFDEANAEMNAILDTVGHDVCSLLVQNYTQNYMPPNPLAKIGAMLALKHERIGISVVVTQSAIVRNLLGMMVKLYPAASHLRFAGTVEEGRNIIRLYRIQKGY